VVYPDLIGAPLRSVQKQDAAMRSDANSWHCSAARPSRPRLPCTRSNPQKLAAIYPSKEFTDVGGLMAYGVSYPDLYFRSATFIDKIFRGAKAGDLPVEQPTKLELIINLAAAKALGLTVPPSLITRADEIIE
jgi:ABC-type uncharacterized transport system substrate-binding protein